MFLLYHAYVYLEFLILACTIYILAPELQNENLIVAMQRLSFKERFVVTEYVLKGKPFKEIAQETGLKEKAVASAYYRSIKKLRAKMGDVK